MSYTFGRTSTTTTSGTSSANYKYGGKFTLSENAEVSSLWVYCSAAAGGAATCKGLIYADSGGSPAALEGTTAELSVAAGSSALWRELTFAAAVSLTAGDYWLVVWSGTAYLTLYRDTTGGSHVVDYDIYSAPPAADPFGTPDDTGTRYYCFYAEYEIANQVPNAPTITYPTGGETIELASGQTFTWTFSDPDSGDTQSAYTLRYRVTGATSWTTLSEVVSANSKHTFAGGTFAAGSWEWQVKTKDQDGDEGAYCSSSTFTAATTPGLPVVVTPAVDETISTASYSCTWVAAAQDDYQVRRVADDGAGSPDTGTIYEDSGTVNSATRAHTLTFTVNARTEHVQVRVRVSSVWSSWASVRVLTGFTPPQTPTIVVTANSTSAYISVVATHPAPGGGQPTVVSEDIYRSETNSSSDAIRIYTGNTPAATYYDYACASDTDYWYFVRAVGDTGATADSALTS